MVVTAEPAAPRRGGTWWRVAAAVEVTAAAAAVLVDRIVPTVVLVALALVSLAARREGFATLGFHRAEHPWRMAVDVFGWVVAWTLLLVAVVMPVLEHLTGERQDMSQFDGLEGNAAQLAGLLLLSWTLAAVGEELAYRGYVLTRTADVIGRGTLGLVVGVGASAALFALAHTEQGVVGVALTFLDALFFAAMRFRHGNNLWASVIAHGANNTIGLTAVYLVGPVHGLW